MSVTNIKSLIEDPITGEWGEEGKGVKIIRTTNFTNEGRLDLRDVVERNVSEQKVARKKLRLGDIILEKSGGSPNQPVGRVVYFDVDAADTFLCNNFTTVLRPKNEVNSRYLFWFLFYQHIAKNTLRFQNKTTGILNLQLDRYLESLQIPYPSYESQQKIAAILDQADCIRRKDQQLLLKYDELLQSIFYQMFGDPVKNEKGWETVILSHCCSRITDGTHDTPQRLKEGVKFITGKHVRPFRIDYQNSDYVTEEVHKEIYRRCNPQFGDVLYTNIGVNLATAAMNIVDYEFSMKNVALLKPKKDLVVGRFLEHCLNNHRYKNKVVSLTGIGGAQQFLSLNQIKSLQIPLPSLPDQAKFANIVDTIEEQKNYVIKQINESGSLFQSLLQKAFKGELIN